ncbi:hypothetical protein [Candidatus Phytoplasma prunorum]|uniref:hypothetical protein n=1 Tax=Candidatus Phytoplasma prunorum TaxID=47565 RepID=UPI002FF0B435
MFKKSHQILSVVTLTYVLFIVTNLIALIFDLEIGLRANMMISIISDLFFIIYLWYQEFHHHEN